MKQHKSELDVDFIGGVGPLTKEEEQAITAFIRARKPTQQKQASNRKSTTSKKSFATNGKRH